MQSKENQVQHNTGYYYTDVNRSKKNRSKISLEGLDSNRINPFQETVGQHDSLCYG